MPEYCNCLLLTVICLTDLGPFRPGIIFCPLIGCFGHHLNLGYRLTTMTDTGSHTVVPGITTTDDHHILILCIDKLSVLESGIQETFCICLQEIDRKVDSLCISSRGIYISGIGCTAGKHDSVVFFKKLLRLDILPYIHTSDKGNSFFLHHLYLAIHNMLFQLHIRNSIHEQPADPVRALIHCHAVSALIELISHCKTGRPASDHRYLLSGSYLGGLGRCIALLISIFYDSVLVFLGGYRFTDQPASAGCFTESRTHSRSELRKAVRLFQSIVCLLPVSHINQVIPLRHQIMQRASTGHSADCHT